MTNWKTYKIEHLNSNSKLILINLGLESEVHIDYKDKWEEHGFLTYLKCPTTYPFNTWKEGDYIEIDNDKTKYKSAHDFCDTSMARKVTSTNVITTCGSFSDIVISPSAVNAMKSPRTMEIAREMSRMVDETGKNWEYKIEVENKDGKKISHSLICRKD